MKVKIVFLWLTILGGVIYSQTENQIVYQLFRSSNTATELCYQTINYAAQAIFGTKDITGTFKAEGTLTQISVTPANWKYDSTPAGKLVVKFTDGTVVEIVYKTADGYDKGSYSDFVSAHTTFLFSMKIAGILDLNIQSQALYSGNQGDNTIKFSRTITGTYNFSGTWITVNINNNGTTHTISSGGTYLEYATNETATGTSTTAISSTNINEQYYSMIISSRLSTPAVYVNNKILTNNSSLTMGGTSYAFQNAVVKWAAASKFDDGIFNKVVDANYWQASGALLKNNKAYGNIGFDEAVVNQTDGPKAVATLADKSTLLIHQILQSWVKVTDVKDDELIVNSDYSLEQNYPNPFNPITTLKYSIPVETLGPTSLQLVTLKVYDLLGREAAVLVNEEKVPGAYEVKFDAGKLASGVYYYRLKAGNFVETKKMMYMK